MPHRDKTRLVRTARGHIGAEPCSVNPPIVRTSTVLCKDAATLASIERRRAKGERIFSHELAERDERTLGHAIM
jgi:hypothetical protein